MAIRSPFHSRNTLMIRVRRTIESEQARRMGSGFASYTARVRNFAGPEEYGRWIADDARNILKTSIKDQVKMYSFGPLQRLKNKISLKLKALGIKAH